jgi:hypothetical protein
MKLVCLLEDITAKLENLKKILLGKKSIWLQRKLKRPVDASIHEPVAGASSITPELQQAAAEEIKNSAQWDPTTRRELDGIFIQFIVRNIANNSIKLPEDGPPLKETLDTFVKASKKGSWIDKKDIMQFTDWRELQRSTMEWTKKNQEGSRPSSETEWVKRAKAGSEKITEFDITTTGGNVPGNKHYVVIQLNTPIAVTVYGRGTQWCTSCSLYKTIRPHELEQNLTQLSNQGQKIEGNPWANVDRKGFLDIITDLNDGNITKSELKIPNPYLSSALNNAVSYLRDGPMFLIFKNGSPYIQMSNSGRDVMNINDIKLRGTSPALALVFRKMIESGKMSESMKKVLESHINSSGLKELEAKGFKF